MPSAPRCARARRFFRQLDVRFDPDRRAVQRDRRQRDVARRAIARRRGACSIAPRARPATSGGGSIEHLAGRSVHREQRARRESRRWRAARRRPPAGGSIAPGSRCDTSSCPASVTKPASRCRSSCAISDGLSSSATRTSGPSTSRNRSSGSPPARRFMHRRPTTSATSPLRSRRYGSSILSNSAETSSSARCERGLGVEPLGADDRRGAIDQHRIVEHQPLRVEQVGVLGAGGGRDALLDVARSARARCAARRVEPLELAVDAPLGDAEAQVGASRA